jgi:ribonuclease BN (tRNA processing enzyme)
MSDPHDHGHDQDHECLCDTLPNGPVRSEADEAIDEARRGTRLTRRSMLAGLGLVAGAPVLAACSPTESTPSATQSPGATATPGATPTAPGSVVSNVNNRLKLVLLGTRAGPPVQPGQKGISSALVVNDKTYVVDCGRSAVTQYVDSGLRFDSLEHIFLTHMHADHLADYYNFFMLGGHIKNQLGDHIDKQVKVLGPGKAGGLTPRWTPQGNTDDVPTLPPGDTGTVEMTELLRQAYSYSMNIFLRDMAVADVRTLMDVKDIQIPAGVNAAPMDWQQGSTAPDMEPFEIFRDDNVVVKAILVPHGVVFPAYAFRFDTEHGSVTFSGDTTHSENLIKLADQTDILVHEAIGGGEQLPEASYQHMKDSHVFIQECGPIAEKAGAKHMVISHYAELDETMVNYDEFQRLAQQGYNGEVTIGKELDIFGLGPEQ